MAKTVTSWMCHLALSWGVSLIVMCHVTKTQGRRGTEGPEAMARGESTETAAAAHALFRTALFGCPETEKKKRNKSPIQRAPLLEKDYLQESCWILLEMLGSSHLGTAVLWVFSWNLWIQQSADMLFLAFCDPSSRATGAWLKDTQKHQPPTFQHFHRFNTP